MVLFASFSVVVSVFAWKSVKLSPSKPLNTAPFMITAWKTKKVLSYNNIWPSRWVQSWVALFWRTFWQPVRKSSSKSKQVVYCQWTVLSLTGSWPDWSTKLWCYNNFTNSYGLRITWLLDWTITKIVTSNIQKYLQFGSGEVNYYYKKTMNYDTGTVINANKT